MKSNNSKGFLLCLAFLWILMILIDRDNCILYKSNMKTIFPLVLLAIKACQNSFEKALLPRSCFYVTFSSLSETSCRIVDTTPGRKICKEPGRCVRRKLGMNSHWLNLVKEHQQDLQLIHYSVLNK